MAVRYFPIDNESVSEPWYRVLVAARAAGVSFHVNEGHRTMARQWYFWNLYRSGRGNLAAYPSPNAPHIRTGRVDHAIDFNGASNIIHWLRQHGVNATLPVRGESWHVEVPAGQLVALAKRLHAHRTLKLGSRGNDVRRLQLMLRRVGRWPKKRKVGKTFGIRTKYAVVAYQRSQHIKADGIYGPNTRRHLEADYKRKMRA